jgi:hypothetical protein
MKKVILALGIVFLFAACKKDVPQKQLTVKVTPEVGGAVSPSSGTYAMGSTVTVLATPSPEYIFKEWTGGFTGTTNPANVIMDVDKTVTAVFEKREYPLSLTIVGSGTVKEEIIKIASLATNYKSGTTVRLTPQPSAGFQFKKWSGDDTTSKTPLDLVVSKAINLTCTFEKMTITSMKVENLLDTLIISKKHKYIVKGIYSNGATIDLSDSVKITSSTAGINVLTDRNLIGAQSGNIVLSVTYNNLLIKDTAYVSEIENVDLKTVPFLTSPSNPNARIIVPVVVVNYYPTLNGIDIDTKRAPGLGTPSPITVEGIKDKTVQFLNLTKYGLEQGSRFRGYNNQSQVSSVSFKIVKYINVYEIKRGLPGVQKEITDRDPIRFKQDILTPVYQPDYFDVFSKINLKQLIENEGVKEVWFSLRPISSEYPVVRDSLINGITAANFINLPESNMSSLLSGDVSNSYRMSNDLPVYNKTYVVYGYNLETSSANMIHNRGHQIEAQLSHLDGNFWGSYSNKTDGYADSTRLGWTHCPPNTTKDYDWNNKTLTLSDIEDWKPTGGTKKLLNSDRWMNINYTSPNPVNLIPYDPNDPQLKWLIFWMQSIPGYNNGITGVNDWWDLFYNWDDAVKNKSKLNN